MGPRNELVTAAACDFIATTITAADINFQSGSSTPYWRKVLDYGLKHRVTAVQESAASAISTVSKLVDCYEIVSR
jgi:tubulin-specific chaperone D